MKRNLLVFAVMVVVVLFSNLHNVEAQQDPNDLGLPDSIIVQTFDCDHIYQAEPGSFDSVRVAIYVTHDKNVIPGSSPPMEDSIMAFVIPLTFWHQPPGCADSVILPFQPHGWNNSDLYPYLPWMNRSIFRHIVDTHTGDTTYNRLLQMVENGKEAWSAYTDFESHSCDGDSGRAYVSAHLPNPACQRWWEGTQVLFATLTFHVYMSEACDTTEIGLDSAFWPPASQLTFTRYDWVVYYPQHNLPVKDTIYIDSICGDCNRDGVVNIADVVCLINYLFAGEPPPDSLCILDANCDTLQNIADVVYLINYLFIGGLPPCPACCSQPTKPTRGLKRIE